MAKNVKSQITSETSTAKASTTKASTTKSVAAKTSAAKTSTAKVPTTIPDNMSEQIMTIKMDWIADNQKRHNVENIMKSQNITIEWKNKPTLKTNANINDNGVVTCAACSHTFNIDSITDEDTLKRIHQTGLCPQCLEQLAKFTQAAGIKITYGTAGPRVIKNGGQNAGKRIRDAFAIAIKHDNFTDEILNNMQSKEWSKKNLGISPFAFLKNITGLSAAEIDSARKEDDSKGRIRYLNTPYIINNQTFLMTNNLFSKNIEIIQNTFKKLNLIPADYNI